MRTDEELRQIALDMFKGLVFSSYHCKSAREISMVFMPLLLLDDFISKEIKDNKVNFIFEYGDKASPRRINGKPIFFSFSYLLPDEEAKMFTFYNKFKEMEEAI